MNRKSLGRSVEVAYYWAGAFGVDLRRVKTSLSGLTRYIVSYRKARSQKRALKLDRWPLSCSFPQVHDFNDVSGIMRGHYFHQDLWVAQQIYKRNPHAHLDIGSRIDGFVAHVASFRSIDVLDLRKNESKLPAIRYVQADITRAADPAARAYPSVSCLHALEHFGLGRYGDEVDLLAYKKGFAGLSRMTLTGGILYFAVPIGVQRIEFNAHRVFSIEEVRQLYEQEFRLTQFAYVDDDGDIHIQPEPVVPVEVETLWYGCGIFVLEKR